MQIAVHAYAGRREASAAAAGALRVGVHEAQAGDMRVRLAGGVDCSLRCNAANRHRKGQDRRVREHFASDTAVEAAVNGGV